jgi:bacteriorhodopsin
MPALPRWVWWIIGAVIVLVIVVLLKVNIHRGSNGAGITQDLVK